MIYSYGKIFSQESISFMSNLLSDEIEINNIMIILTSFFYRKMFFLREMIDNDYKSIGTFMVDHCFKWVEPKSSKACVCLHF